MTKLNLPEWTKRIQENGYATPSETEALLSALSEAREALEILRLYHGPERFWGDNQIHPGRIADKALNFNPTQEVNK